MTKTFLLSSNVFEGDSGGPVFLAEPNRLVEGKPQPQPVRLILGLVAGQHFLDEDLKSPYEIRKVRHRLGLAIIPHASFIRETLEALGCTRREEAGARAGERHAMNWHARSRGLRSVRIVPSSDHLAPAGRSSAG